MTLPIMNAPVYELTIPSNGKEIQVRPFLVKEEKLLLIALESANEMDIINTTKQVIKNCILTEGIDIDKLPFFDIDYIFIFLRAKSVGDMIEVNFKCNNQVNEEVCGNSFKVNIDISKYEVIKSEDVSLDIKLSPKILLKMKYPSYAIMKLMSEDATNIEKKIRIIADCIEKIIEGDKIYTTKDFTSEEAKKFIEELTQEQFKKLEYFIDNLPSFIIKAEETCNKCGFKHDIKYDDFTSFFL